MNRYIDKGIILALCFSMLVQDSFSTYAVIPLLIALAVTAIAEFDCEPVTIATFAAYMIAAVFLPDFLFFVPLVCYSMAQEKRRWWLVFALIPIGLAIQLKPSAALMVLLFSTASCIMEIRTNTLQKLDLKYTELRDSSKELSIRLEDKNKELREKQDYEVSVATLNERNRIARDIHDNVGHVLSSAILQTGALLAVCKDSSVKDGLRQLKETLLHGMDSIRRSVHALYDESIDLSTEIRTIIDNFKFCPISLEYDVDGNPDKKVKYAFIAIVKEALANVIRHSDATSVHITLREHPALFQLIIADNGSKTEISEGGMGIENISVRVKSLNGILNISRENGFKLFVSVPKGSVEN